MFIGVANRSSGSVIGAAHRPLGAIKSRSTLIQNAIDLVEGLYIPDLLLIASFYSDWARMGGGLGNFLAYGDVPQNGIGNISQFLFPQGVVRNRNLNAVEPLDLADATQIREHVGPERRSVRLEGMRRTTNLGGITHLDAGTRCGDQPRRLVHELLDQVGDERRVVANPRRETSENLALDALMNGHATTAYNVGIGQGYSNKEIVAAVKRASGRELQVQIGPRRPGDASESVADTARLRKEFGWAPRVSDLETIVGSAWKWHSSHPKGYEDK